MSGDWLEEFWADILSETPSRVMAAWSALDSQAKTAVYDHLRRMATEDGWAQVQRAAAEVALAAIGEYTPPASTEGE